MLFHRRQHLAAGARTLRTLTGSTDKIITLNPNKLINGFPFNKPTKKRSSVAFTQTPIDAHSVRSTSSVCSYDRPWTGFLDHLVLRLERNGAAVVMDAQKWTSALKE
ncbi:hypothetical protein BaRGS_00025101 [Batillaria attramentaria]|uniref:Uncharacterized protein n=1 Tax=Batillaria attramentaria TaxID=370345 RepID=A0ABD0K9D0_9CAEN